MDTFEQIARIGSYIAVPIIVAVVGYFIESAISSRAVANNYVQLAVSILNDPLKIGPLRTWAVNLLEKYSPVDLPDDLKPQLAAGNISLPASWTVDTHPGNLYRAGTAVVRVWPPAVWVWSGGGRMPDNDSVRLKQADLRLIDGEDRVRVLAVQDGVEYSSVLTVPDPEFRDRLLSVLQANVGMTISEISKLKVE